MRTVHRKHCARLNARNRYYPLYCSLILVVLYFWSEGGRRCWWCAFGLCMLLSLIVHFVYYLFIYLAVCLFTCCWFKIRDYFSLSSEKLNARLNINHIIVHDYLRLLRKVIWFCDVNWFLSFLGDNVSRQTGCTCWWCVKKKLYLNFHSFLNQLRTREFTQSQTGFCVGICTSTVNTRIRSFP